MTFLERFWARVDTSGDCWRWTGYANNKGYGWVKTRSCRVLAHRLSHELASTTPIPPGMFVCHRCDNPPCVNPEHLFLGTVQDNVDDRVLKGRSHVPARFLTLDGETAHLGAWARRCGVSRQLISQRLGKGWSVRAAMVPPAGRVAMPRGEET